MKAIKAVELGQQVWPDAVESTVAVPAIFRRQDALLKLAKDFARYVVVGGAAFLVDYMILSTMLSFGGHYLLATVAGFLAGLLTNYMLCVCWVWRGTEARSIKDLFVFSAIGVGGLLLTALLMWIGVEQLELDARVSKIFIAAVVLIWNFALRRIFVFFH